MRLIYLKNHQSATYTAMTLKDTLWPHLIEIDEVAQKQVDSIVEAMARQDGTDEALKARDPMRWVELMNNYLHCAEEIVLHDLLLC